MRLEDKFFSVWTGRNYLRIIMTSNNDNVVRADLSERRYAIFDVAPPFQSDPDARREYFGAMVRQMEDGGTEAMLGELLMRDISRWNPEAIPATPAAEAQKINSLINDPVIAWYYERLCDGILITTGQDRLEGRTFEWGKNDARYVPVSEVIADITAYAKSRSIHFSTHKVKNKLERFMPADFRSLTRRERDIGHTANPRTLKVYPFPTIADARRLFTEATGIVFDEG